jgi:hypothetical protein
MIMASLFVRAEKADFPDFDAGPGSVVDRKRWL